MSKFSNDCKISIKIDNLSNKFNVYNILIKRFQRFTKFNKKNITLNNFAYYHNTSLNSTKESQIYLLIT